MYATSGQIFIYDLFLIILFKPHFNVKLSHNLLRLALFLCYLYAIPLSSFCPVYVNVILHMPFYTQYPFSRCVLTHIRCEHSDILCYPTQNDSVIFKAHPFWFALWSIIHTQCLSKAKINATFSPPPVVYMYMPRPILRIRCHQMQKVHPNFKNCTF